MTKSRTLRARPVGVLVTLLATCMGACGSDAQMEESAESPLLGLPSVRYFYEQNNLIDVCFNGAFLWTGESVGRMFKGTWTTDTSRFSTEKEWIQSAIFNQWGRNSGLKFTFHSTCPSPVPSAYVPVVLLQGYRLGDIGGVGAAGIGCRMGKDCVSADNPDLEGTDIESQMQLFVYKDNPYSESTVKETAVHEMGHVLGMAHEQDKGDADCQTNPQDTGNGLYFTADYDHESIMNYCRDTNHDGVADAYRPEHNENLTELDKAGVQMVYGFPDAWYYQNKQFCRATSAKMYTGKFNADGRTDILCNDSAGMVVDLADSQGAFWDADWSWSGSWCLGSYERLLVGDVNGDGRDDLICSNNSTGAITVDLAEPDGSFPYDSWSGALSYCNSSSAKMYGGKFNADGRTDLLCNGPSGINVDLASGNGEFADADWSWGAPWCFGSTARLLIGDVNGDGRDDLVCHDKANGRITVDLAEPDGSFPYDSWGGGDGFCVGAYESPFIADMDGNGKADLVCRSSGTGAVQMVLGQANGSFTPVKFRGPFAGFCAGLDNEVYKGNFKGTARSDLLCNDQHGAMGVQYSTLPAIY